MKINQLSSRIVAIIAISLITAASTFAGIDKKYYEKIAQSIWNNTDTSIFDPKKEIPDSLTADNSAVIIAWTTDIDVENVVQPSIYLPRNETNRLEKVMAERKMVKLLDDKGVELFSEHTFGATGQIKATAILYELKSAFGARIYKPDGRMIEVDLSAAVEIGDGKKGKDDKEYKIVIPGLEPGDVLDYFTYVDEWAEYSDLSADNIMLVAEHPILERRVRVATNPKMTVEYKGYNGVPEMSRYNNDKGNPETKLAIQNMPGVNSHLLTMPLRQLPFLRVQYINNTTNYMVAQHARRGGLHANLHPGIIMSEFTDYLKDMPYDTPLTGRAQKAVKDYFVPAHPDASPRELTDALWLATRYHELTAKSEKEKSGQMERALILTDLIRKFKIYPADSVAIGLITSRASVPTRDISAWNEASAVVKTPDALYITTPQMSFAPGEMPGLYKGETAVLYYGDRRDISRSTLAAEYTVPSKRSSENSTILRDIITINPDDDMVTAQASVELAGGYKSYGGNLTEKAEWVAEAEDFFNIPANKRANIKDYDAVGRKKEISDALKSMMKDIYSTKPDSITSYEVKSRGIRPDETKMAFDVTSTFKGLVEPLGDDLNFAIGRLMGMPEPVKEHDRKRLIDVMYPFISQDIQQHTVKAPEGYAFDAASVEALSTTLNNVLGQFVVTAALNDAGDLEINVVVRTKIADIPLSHWPELLKMLDTMSAFGDASVVLTRK